MHNKLLIIATIVLLTGSFTANAVPVNYNVNYSATLGPNGTGSFAFDNAIGAITNYVWDFGGIIGGEDGVYSTVDVFGDTLGRFVFEMLSQTDVHSGVNCIGVVGCSTTGGIATGSGPGGAAQFQIRTNGSVVDYSFFGAQGNVVATGIVSIAKVSEPGTLSLLCVALLGAGLALRRRRI